MDVFLRRDERVLHGDSLAKYAAAFLNVALLRDQRQLASQPDQFGRWLGLPAGPGERSTMRGDLLLPFVAAISEAGRCSAFNSCTACRLNSGWTVVAGPSCAYSVTIVPSMRWP